MSAHVLQRLLREIAELAYDAGANGDSREATIRAADHAAQRMVRRMEDARREKR